jgi:hypothetical protein
MFRTILTLLVAATTHQGIAQPARSAGRELAAGAANLDFIIVNRTRKTVVGLSITPTGERAGWSDDILVQTELCRWDIRATYSDRRQQTWRGINLCDTIRVVLR